MNEPETYVQFGTGGERTKFILNKYTSIFNGNSKYSVLDIGSGPGNITFNIVYSLLKDNVEEMVGVDISSKMVEFANSVYANEKLTFQQMNIEGSVPTELLKRFDYVVSFWVLHWVVDIRTTFKNISKMLKPGGSTLLYFIANSQLFDAYKKVWTLTKWAPYISDCRIIQSPYQNSKNPESDLKKDLQEVGFEVEICYIDKMIFEFTTDDECRGLLLSLIPILDKIPSYLKDDFIEDHLKYFRVQNLHSNVKYTLNHNSFVLYAKSIR